MCIEGSNLMPVTEVGRLLGVSDDRVRKLIVQGRLPAIRVGAVGIRLVRREDAEMLRRQREASRGRSNEAP